MSNDNPVSVRQRIEREIAKLLATAAIREGFSISVDIGGEIVLRRSMDVSAVLAAMFSTDEDVLHFFGEHADGKWKRLGWAHLIYGNCGYDVIHDYTSNLSELTWFKRVEKTIEHMEQNGVLPKVSVEWRNSINQPGVVKLVIDGVSHDTFRIDDRASLPEQAAVSLLDEVFKRLAETGAIEYASLTP